MKKEVKIGIYAVVILLSAWAGIRFLSGLDVFGRTRNYTAHYEQVNGLQDAAAVVINGVKVGQVTGVELNIEQGGVDVNLSVSKEYDIPTDHPELKSLRGKVWVLESSGALKYKYCYGDFADKATAQRHIEDVRKDFPQAFIITYEK